MAFERTSMTDGGLLGKGHQQKREGQECAAGQTEE